MYKNINSWEGERRRVLVLGFGVICLRLGRLRQGCLRYIRLGNILISEVFFFDQVTLSLVIF